MQYDKIILAGASAVSTAVGVVVGYQVAKKKLATHFEELSAQEIAEAREFYAALNKKGDFETPEKAAETLGVTSEFVTEAAEALVTYQGQVVEPVTKGEGLMDLAQEMKPEQSPVEVTTNIFVDGKPLNPDDFDIDEERELRRNGVPYVVSDEEYEENPDHHEQAVLTYFAQDNVLVDENEAAIDDIRGTIGDESLKRFGHGSGDPNVVFVRNEARGIDFEVLRSNGSYAEEVLGLTPDVHLEHSAMPRRGRRVFDE